MVNVYKILEDKYGEYFIYNNKKRRIKTLLKNNTKFTTVYNSCENEKYIIFKGE